MLEKYFKRTGAIVPDQEDEGAAGEFEYLSPKIGPNKETVARNTSLAQGASCGAECKICRLEFFIEPRWRALLVSFIRTESCFPRIKHVLHSAKKFYPPVENVFNFTRLITFSTIKVVIIGQDPYHNPGQAMGLSFSVPRGVRVPPSLANIYKELAADIPGFVAPKHGDLTEWAVQGVLLLNRALTVVENSPASHSEIWWPFTEEILKQVDSKLSNVVFMLWGNHAKQVSKFIDRSKHLILEAGHPSPLSVRGFLGCKHFSKANEYLQKHSMGQIDWKLH